MSSASVKGRQWQSIVDHDIVRKSNIDSSRHELKIEVDPFINAGNSKPSVIPTTELPKAQANKFSNTMSVPAATPSTNGSCEDGQSHYEIHMMDTWGDGWDQTVITITGMSNQALPSDAMTTHTNQQGDMVTAISNTIDLHSSNEKDPIFQGTLQEGYQDSAHLCLVPNRCYQLVATGGEFSAEVSWEIRQGSNMEPILTGSAPTECTFSIPNEEGEQFCPNTCIDGNLANLVVDTSKVSETSNLSNEDPETPKATETPTYWSSWSSTTAAPEPEEEESGTQFEDEIAPESISQAVGRTTPNSPVVVTPSATSATNLWSKFSDSDPDV